MFSRISTSFSAGAVRHFAKFRQLSSKELCNQMYVCSIPLCGVVGAVYGAFSTSQDEYNASLKDAISHSAALAVTGMLVAVASPVIVPVFLIALPVYGMGRMGRFMKKRD